MGMVKRDVKRGHERMSVSVSVSVNRRNVLAAFSHDVASIKMDLTV